MIAYSQRKGLHRRKQCLLWVTCLFASLLYSSAQPGKSIRFPVRAFDRHLSRSYRTCKASRGISQQTAGYRVKGAGRMLRVFQRHLSAPALRNTKFSVRKLSGWLSRRLDCGICKEDVNRFFFCCSGSSSGKCSRRCNRSQLPISGAGHRPLHFPKAKCHYCRGRKCAGRRNSCLRHQAGNYGHIWGTVVSLHTIIHSILYHSYLLKYSFHKIIQSIHTCLQMDPHVFCITWRKLSKGNYYIIYPDIPGDKNGSKRHILRVLCWYDLYDKLRFCQSTSNLSFICCKHPVPF